MIKFPLISIITSVYKGTHYLDGFLENVSQQTIAERSELILIINEGTETDYKNIERYQEIYPGEIIKTSITPVESLAKSWTRGCRAARGEFISLWNVDDRRPLDSLERQISSLISNTECSLSYGDFLFVDEPGQRLGKPFISRPFSKKDFCNGAQTGGAFLVFKKNIFEQVNYFDEQLKIGVDFDFEQRIVHSNIKMVKTDGIIGYFTHNGTGLSTNLSTPIPVAEQTAIRLRYGIFQKVKFEGLKDGKKYKLDQYLIDDRWVNVDDIILGHNKYLKGRKHLWIECYFRTIVRTLLSFTGLLKIAVQLRDMIIKSKYSKF